MKTSQIPYQYYKVYLTALMKNALKIFFKYKYNNFQILLPKGMIKYKGIMKWLQNMCVN